MHITYLIQYKKYFLILLGTIAFRSQVSAQVGIDTALSNALQHSIDSMCVAYNLKGISAAAYIPGKGMWKGVTGVSHLSLPIDTTMIFSMGSITKTFAASEMLKLQEAGLLSLSDTIGALLPAMANVDPAITVAQLLSHTSGMGEYMNSSWSSAMNLDPTLMWHFPDALAAFCPVAVGPPGSPFKYCNSNYNLAGMIIEAKKADSFHRVLRTDFLSPLGLNNTYMEMFEPYPNTIPHNWSTPTLNPALAVDASSTPHQALWSSTEPAGGFFTDPADLAKWGYNLYSGNVLSPASLSQMLTFTPVAGTYFNGYGLGVMRFSSSGRTYYGHGGNFFGYAASMLYYPVDSICVAVLINQDCIAYYQARILMNTVLNKLTTAVKDREWSNKIAITPNPANRELNIAVPGNSSKIDLLLCDVAGREVYKGSMNAGASTINTANFKSGEYFVRLISGDQVVTKQIIIQH